MVRLPDISTIGEISTEQRRRAHVAGWPTNEREELAHAIVYPAKTKPTGAFKE
jgi:hypothetical protein